MTPKDKKPTSTSALNQKLGAEKHDDAKMEEVSQEALLDHPSYLSLQEKLNETEQKANEYWERILRMQAEKTNFERISKQDIENAHKYALEKFASDLLPIIDSLERAIDAHSNDEGGADSMLEGVTLTYKMFITTLEKFGIKQVDPMGTAFNPEFHQAVSAQPDPSVKPNTVINVLQKGYLLNNRLVRPALVIVAK